MTLDEFFKEFDWCKGSFYQSMQVSVNGKEYSITDAYPCADAVVDPNDQSIREEDNYRIVFEVK